MNMDDKELTTIGKKILKLRKEQKMTQATLAAKLHVSNRTISKWETDMSTPDLTMIIRISKIFNVDINLLVDTTNVNIEMKRTFKDIIFSILKFFIAHLIKIVFYFVVVLLVIYFLANYNTVKLFNIKSSDNEVTIDGGIFFESKVKNVLIINNIKVVNASSDILMIKTELYTFINSDKVSIYESDNLDSISISEFSGYEEHLSKDIIKAIKKGLYLSVDVIDTEGETAHYEIKLSLKKSYSNDKLIYFKKDKSLDNKTIDNHSTTINIDEVILINNNFQKDEATGVYSKKIDDAMFYVDLGSNKIVVSKETKKSKITYTIYLNKYLMKIEEFNKDKSVKKKLNYNYQTEEMTCDEGICNNYLDDVKYVFGVLETLK